MKTSVAPAWPTPIPEQALGCLCLKAQQRLPRPGLPCVLMAMEGLQSGCYVPGSPIGGGTTAAQAKRKSGEQGWPKASQRRVEMWLRRTEELRPHDLKSDIFGVWVSAALFTVMWLGKWLPLPQPPFTHLLNGKNNIKQDHAQKLRVWHIFHNPEALAIITIMTTWLSNNLGEASSECGLIRWPTPGHRCFSLWQHGQSDDKQIYILN